MMLPFDDPDLVFSPSAPAGKKPKYAPNGYAAAPGSGPAGETCRGCAHATRVVFHAQAKFWKCGLRKPGWTQSYGTDIRLKSPACRFFERRAAGGTQ